MLNRGFVLVAVATFVALSGSPAWAGIENRNAFPFGEVEGFTGNAGVAGSPSTGAIYYNPAALTLVEHGRISVSGSTYVYLQSSTDEFARLDNTNIPYSSSGFDTVPSAISSIFRLNEKWVASYFILSPEKYKLDNRQTLVTPNTRTTLIEVQNVDDLWAGLSAAYAYNDQWSFGASLSLIQHKELSTVTVQMVFPSIPNSILFRVDHLDSSVMGLSAILGALYQPGGDWQFGLRLQTPLIKITGSGSGYASGQVLSSGTLTGAEREDQEINAQYELPFDFTFGTRVRMGSSWSLLADLSLQTGSEYDPYPGSVFSTNVSVAATPRLNLGAEMRYSQTSLFGFGVYYNPSAIHSLSGRPEGAYRTDIVGLTGGYVWTSGRIRTGLGLFYLWSKGQIIPFNEPSTTAVYRRTGMGALLNISYYL